MDAYGPEFYDRGYFGPSRGTDEAVEATWAFSPCLTGERILDLGCGRGVLLRLAALAGCRACGVDFSPVAVEMAKEKLGALRAPRHRPVLVQRNILEYRGRCLYDHVFLCDVIEHLTREQSLKLLHIAQVALRPGGFLHFHTPISQDFLKYAGHVHIWDSKELLAALKELRFVQLFYRTIHFKAYGTFQKTP